MSEERRDESLQTTLRAQGYRLTPQRQLVLRAVIELGHGTPDEICLEVQRTAGGVNISTVYRTLELLEELGLVTHTHLGHGAPTYHSASDEDHLHLVCRICGQILETDVSIAGPSHRRPGRSSTASSADVTHFAIFGRCKDCVS